MAHVVDVRASNLRGHPRDRSAYCGATVGPFDWAFLDATHAVCSLSERSSVPLCPACGLALLRLLAPGTYPSDPLADPPDPLLPDAVMRPEPWWRGDFLMKPQEMSAAAVREFYEGHRREQQRPQHPSGGRLFADVRGPLGPPGPETATP